MWNEITAQPLSLNVFKFHAYGIQRKMFLMHAYHSVYIIHNFHSKVFHDKLKVNCWIHVFFVLGQSWWWWWWWWWHVFEQHYKYCCICSTVTICKSFDAITNSQKPRHFYNFKKSAKMEILGPKTMACLGKREWLVAQYLNYKLLYDLFRTWIM